MVQCTCVFTLYPRCQRGWRGVGAGWGRGGGVVPTGSGVRPVPVQLVSDCLPLLVLLADTTRGIWPADAAFNICFNAVQNLGWLITTTHHHTSGWRGSGGGAGRVRVGRCRMEREQNRGRNEVTTDRKRWGCREREVPKMDGWYCCR